MTSTVKIKSDTDRGLDGESVSVAHIDNSIAANVADGTQNPDDSDADEADDGGDGTEQDNDEDDEDKDGGMAGEAVRLSVDLLYPCTFS